MFNPTLLFHKTTAVCSFRTPSTFLHTWLIRPPLTIVPRGISLQVHAMESFAGCLLVCPCFVVSRFIKFTIVASKATMYVAEVDVTFCFSNTRIVSLYMYM